MRELEMHLLLNIKSHGVYGFVDIIVFLLNKIFKQKHYDCNFSRRYFKLEKINLLNLMVLDLQINNLITTKSEDGAVNVAYI
jgi:hypothetical protein